MQISFTPEFAARLRDDMGVRGELNVARGGEHNPHGGGNTYELERAIGWMFVTPALHRRHHGLEAEVVPEGGLPLGRLRRLGPLTPAGTERDVSRLVSDTYRDIAVSGGRGGWLAQAANRNAAAASPATALPSIDAESALVVLV